MQLRDPKYGEWLDVYLTILQPLPLPVGGILGAPAELADHIVHSATMHAVPWMPPVARHS